MKASWHMNPKMIRLIKYFATPFSWLYALGIWVRNVLYDDHVLPSYTVNVPTIAIGNLAVGGTGKTPMTEYLIRLLSADYKVAVLSRGYGRKTRGFRLATAEDTSKTIGDEPMLIHMHFPDHLQVNNTLPCWSGHWICRDETPSNSPFLSEVLFCNFL